MSEFLQYPLVRAALAGAAAAIVIDIRAFLKWRSWDDASTFDWKLASFRLAQGVIAAVLAALVGDALV